MNHSARDIPEHFDDDPDHTVRQQQHHFDHPGELLANFPALFGFYPQDSVVLCTFSHLGGSKYEMGPSIRLDLDDESALDTLADVPGPLDEADFAFLFFIGEGMYGADLTDPRVEEFAVRIDDILHDVGATLMGCWGCDEVLTGEPYQAIGAWEVGGGSNACVQGRWESGRIPAITDAPSMQAWVAAGLLPELSRPDVFERFETPNPYLAEAQRLEVQEFASMLAEGVEGTGRSNNRASAEMVSGLGSVIKDAETRRRGMDDLLEDTTLLTRCATVLTGHRLRDAAILEVLARPAAAAEVMVAAARSLRGQPRANALSLYALAVIAQDLPMSATPAVMSAQEEVPGHRLSLLIYEATQIGGVEVLLRAVTESSGAVRERMGLSRLGFG